MKILCSESKMIEKGSDNMFYQLMRKNDIICMVDIDNDGHFIKRGKILNEELCPLQGRIHRNNLSEWWNDRAIPIKQGKIAQMLKNNGIPTPSVFLVKNLGLSLTDYYWIRPINSDLTWEQVNLFDNNFKENLLLGTIQIPNENETLVHQPNSSLQGNLEKTWVIDKGIRKLIKGNHTELSSESINEVLIADALHRQNFPHAKYDLIKIKGKNYDFGCISPLFTSQNRELITAYAVITSEIQPNNISSYEHFINVCE